MTETLRNGRYVVVSRLGEGAQGETFEAYDTVRGKRVAIKRFRVSTAKAWKDVELAEREVRTLQELHHDRLPKYLEHFEEDGALVLVMDHVDGESLASLRAKSKSMPVAEVRRLLEDVSQALDYLHGRAPAIIHRDIKPSNVIRRKDGAFVLVDFGAVRDRLKPEGGSTVVGTFGYMAPEQFQGRASAATDVYGLGATAIALLTGQEPEALPHKGLGIDVAAALPSSVDPAMQRALEAMLEPDPEKRASSVAEAMMRGRSSSRAPPRPSAERDERDEKRARRETKREARREDREERRARRRQRRGAPRAVPFLPRMIANVGLLIAWIAIWLTVGAIVPALLWLLSFAFGAKLRRAAAACARAAGRAGSAIGRASDRMAGIDVDAASVPKTRIADEVLRSVRAVTPEQAQAEAVRLRELANEDAEAWADEVATREAEKWAEDEEERRWRERVGRVSPRRK